MNAEFFDIFGLVGFLIIIGIGVFILKTKKKTPKNLGWILLLIGVLGAVIDGIIVLRTFII